MNINLSSTYKNLPSIAAMLAVMVLALFSTGAHADTYVSSADLINKTLERNIKCWPGLIIDSNNKEEYDAVRLPSEVCDRARSVYLQAKKIMLNQVGALQEPPVAHGDTVTQCAFDGHPTNISGYADNYRGSCNGDWTATTVQTPAGTPEKWQVTFRYISITDTGCFPVPHSDHFTSTMTVPGTSTVIQTEDIWHNTEPTVNSKQQYGCKPRHYDNLYRGDIKYPPSDCRYAETPITLLNNDNVHLDWQSDGNLVLYRGSGISQPIWDSGTQGNGGYICWSNQNKGMVSLGELTIINKADTQVIWRSNTGGRGEWLYLQTDCNLVITDFNNNPIWSTGTNNCKIPGSQ